MANRREHKFRAAPVGLTLHHVCETRRGFVESCNRKHVKIWCVTCQMMRAISECVEILKELDEKTVYLVQMAECDHQRVFEQAVARTPSGRAKLAAEKKRAEEARKRLEVESDGEPAVALDSDEQEALEIRVEMDEPVEPDELEEVRELGLEAGDPTAGEGDSEIEHSSTDGD